MGREKGEGVMKDRGLRGTNYWGKIGYKDVLYNTGKIATIL